MPSEKFPSHDPNLESTAQSSESTGLDSTMFQNSGEDLTPIPSWEDFQAKRQAEHAAAEAAAARAEARRAERAEQRRQLAEKLQQKEVFHNKIKNIAQKSAFALLVVAALVGTGAALAHEYDEALGPSNIAEQRYEAEKDESVDSITIVNDGRIRTQPDVPDLNDFPNNTLTTVDGGTTIPVDYVYLTNPDYESNGQWVGITTENAVDGGLISEDEAEEDRDGVVWLNNNTDNDTKIILNSEAKNE